MVARKWHSYDTTIKRHLNILLLEDKKSDAVLIEFELRRAGYEVSLDCISTQKELDRCLSNNCPDIVVSDYALPSFDGFAALKIVREHWRDIPFILVSGVMGEDIAIECFRNGASDYVLKDRLARLPVAVERALRESEEKKAKQQTEFYLQQSEERYRALFNSNPFPVWVWELETLKFLAVNDATVAHYGYSRQEFLSMTIKDIRPPEDIPKLLSSIEREEHGSVWRHLKKDGTTVYAEVYSHNIMFEGKRARLTVNNDVTDRLKAEQASSEAERKYRQVVENATDIIYIIDTNDKLVYANPAGVKISGYTLSELQRMRYFDLLIKEHHHLVRRRYMRQFLGKDPVSYLEIAIRTKSGQTVWLGQNSTLVSEGASILGFHVIARDITEQVNAKEELEKSLSVLRATLESINEGILVVDLAQNIEMYNTKFMEIWQVPENLMTTKRGASVISFVAELLKYPQEYLRMVKKTDQDPSVVRVDILELKSGRYIERHSYPRLVKNKITGRVMSFRDISESRNAEERLRQSERQLRALTARAESVREEESTRIAREIHDELGQSLTGLKMDIKWIEKHLESSQKPLRERAVQMSELIDGTIQTIRKIATELRPSILDSLGFLPAIEWQADEFQDRTGIECTLAPPEKNLHFSKEQSIGLFRIFQETLTNIARHADATRVEVRFIEDRDHFVFSVHDDGKGITDKDLANPNSLGILGMTERARLFGGELTVEGKRGAGTCVSVRVPLNHGKVERAR